MSQGVVMAGLDAVWSSPAVILVGVRAFPSPVSIAMTLDASTT